MVMLNKRFVTTRGGSQESGIRHQYIDDDGDNDIGGDLPPNEQ